MPVRLNRATSAAKSSAAASAFQSSADAGNERLRSIKIRPRPADDSPSQVTQPVLAQLFLVDDIARSQPGRQRSAVLAGAVELAERSRLLPGEVRPRPNESVVVVHRHLAPRGRQPSAMDDHPASGFADAFTRAVGESNCAPGPPDPRTWARAFHRLGQRPSGHQARMQRVIHGDNAFVERQRSRQIDEGPRHCRDRSSVDVHYLVAIEAGAMRVELSAQLPTSGTGTRHLDRWWRRLPQGDSVQDRRRLMADDRILGRVGQCGVNLCAVQFPRTETRRRFGLEIGTRPKDQPRPAATQALDLGRVHPAAQCVGSDDQRTAEPAPLCAHRSIIASERRFVQMSMTGVEKSCTREHLRDTSRLLATALAVAGWRKLPQRRCR